MRDVRAARGLRERGQLARRRERARRVDERGPKAERAVRRGVARETAHSLELIRRRRPVVVADLVHAQGGRAYERRDVHGNATSYQMVETLPQSRPRHVVPDVTLTFDLVAAHGIGEGPHRRTLTEDLERHSLA